MFPSMKCMKQELHCISKDGRLTNAISSSKVVFPFKYQTLPVKVWWFPRRKSNLMKKKRKRKSMIELRL